MRRFIQISLLLLIVFSFLSYQHPNLFKKQRSLEEIEQDYLPKPKTISVLGKVWDAPMPEAVDITTDLSYANLFADAALHKVQESILGAYQNITDNPFILANEGVELSLGENVQFHIDVLIPYLKEQNHSYKVTLGQGGYMPYSLIHPFGLKEAAFSWGVEQPIYITLTKNGQNIEIYQLNINAELKRQNPKKDGKMPYVLKIKGDKYQKIDASDMKVGVLQEVTQIDWAQFKQEFPVREMDDIWCKNPYITYHDDRNLGCPQLDINWAYQTHQIKRAVKKFGHMPDVVLYKINKAGRSITLEKNLRNYGFPDVIHQKIRLDVPDVTDEKIQEIALLAVEKENKKCVWHTNAKMCKGLFHRGEFRNIANKYVSGEGNNLFIEVELIKDKIQEPPYIQRRKPNDMNTSNDMFAWDVILPMKFEIYKGEGQFLGEKEVEIVTRVVRQQYLYRNHRLNEEHPNRKHNNKRAAYRYKEHNQIPSHRVRNYMIFETCKYETGYQWGGSCKK